MIISVKSEIMDSRLDSSGGSTLSTGIEVETEQINPTWFTAVVGQYDDPWPQTVAFKSDERGRAGVLKAREIKITYSRRFPLSIWHDANIHPVNEERLVELFDKGDLVVMSHPHHNCVYKEAKHCINLGKDDKGVINRQVDRYRKEGLPEDFGCYATGVMLRRNTKTVRTLMKMWWYEVRTGSVRDQLSLPYVCWKLGVSPVVVSWDQVIGKVVTKKSHNYKHDFARQR